MHPIPLSKTSGSGGTTVRRESRASTRPRLRAAGIWSHFQDWMQSCSKDGAHCEAVRWY